MRFHMNMEFFNNKRLLVILSGVACVLIAFVIFVVSVIGFGNIGAFLGGSPSYADPTPELNTPTLPITPQTTPPASVTDTPAIPGQTTDMPVTTPPATEEPTDTIEPTETETPTDTGSLEPTPTPEIPVTGIEIQQGLERTMTAGSTLQLTLRFLPENATNKAVTWECPDTNVAVVNNNGYVVAVAPGKARITVRSADTGVWAQIIITVTAASVDDVKIEGGPQVNLKVGDSTPLSATIYPSSVAGKTITWTTSNPNVATVDSNGLVTAKGPGTATITAAVDGKTATVTVVVTAPTPPPTEEPEPTLSPTDSPQTGGEGGSDETP